MSLKLILGIDCFNISHGGGFTHLNALLNALNKIVGNEVKVILWGSKALLKKLPNYFWLKKNSNFLLNQNIFARFFWHLFFLRKEVKKFHIDVLLCPGGICVQKLIPSIVMFRNVLPFLNNEVKKYNFIKQIRLKLFKILLIYSFKNSDGIIYLSQWSKSFINKLVDIKKSNVVIPHGVSQRKLKINTNIKKKVVNLIYVSHTSPYKNYDYVLNNIIQLALKNEKFKFKFMSIGEICDGFRIKNWNKLLPKNLEVKFHGKLYHEQTLRMIEKSDICIFASSAENFPNVLLEYMSLGSVCLCNNIEPMQSILGKAGIYFDIRIQHDLQNKIKLIMKNQKLQESLKMLSYKKSKKYTWNKSADLTLKFCHQVARKSLKND